MRRLITTLIAVAVVPIMLNFLCACSSTSTNQANSDKQSVEVNTIQQPDYAVEGYVAIQDETPDDASMWSYIPFMARENIFETPVSPYIQTSMSIYPDDNGTSAEYTRTNEGMITSQGSLYYDSDKNIVYRTYTDGVSYDEPYLIPIGTSTTVKIGSYQEEYTVNLDVPKSLFTVSTIGGTYPDCVCVLEERPSNSKTITTATFFAPSVGEVLITSNEDTGDTRLFEVSTELVNQKMLTTVQ